MYRYSALTGTHCRSWKHGPLFKTLLNFYIKLLFPVSSFIKIVKFFFATIKIFFYQLQRKDRIVLDHNSQLISFETFSNFQNRFKHFSRKHWWKILHFTAFSKKRRDLKFDLSSTLLKNGWSDFNLLKAIRCNLIRIPVY